MSSPVPGPPLIDSPAAAGAVLRDLFLANASRGDNAANDHLVTDLARRIRAQQGCGDGRHPPSRTAAPTPARWWLR